MVVCIARHKFPGIHRYCDSLPISSVLDIQETLSTLMINCNTFPCRYVNDKNTRMDGLKHMEIANRLKSDSYICSQTGHLLPNFQLKNSRTKHVPHVFQSKQELAHR